MKNFKEFYNLIITEKMVKLTPAQLFGLNGKTGEDRVQIMKRLILANEPMELFKGGSFIVTNKDEAARDLDKFDGNTPVNLTGYVVGKENDIVDITSSDIGKAAVFGGGGGITGGTELTALTETAQCYYASAISNVLKKPVVAEDVTIAALKKGAKWVHSDIGVDEVIKKLDDDWIASSILIGNLLLNGGYISNGTHYYRGMGLMDDVYDAKKTVMKNAGLKISDDKWNPGDIWVSNSKKIKWDETSIESLNAQIRDLHKSREVVAISLKKAVKQAQIKTFNLDVAEPPKVIPQDFQLAGKTARSTFFSNKSTSITYTDGKIEGRTGSWLTSYSFEIDGKNAKGGKVGISIIDFMLKQNKVKGLTSTKIIKGELKGGKHDAFASRMYKLYEKIGGNDKVHTNYTKEEFIAEVMIKLEDKKGLDWAFSKYYGMEIIDRVFNERSGKKGLSDMVNFARSTSNVSSAFIKLF
jgi:hypothetical protein